MPKIKRWFPVSHDINSDPEVWEMRNTVGERSLGVWLEFLSIADRNDGRLKGMAENPDQTLLKPVSNAIAFKLHTRSKVIDRVFKYACKAEWIVFDPVCRVRNYTKYNRSRGNFNSHAGTSLAPPLTRPDLTRPNNKKNHKNDSLPALKITAGKKEFPSDWKWLEELIRRYGAMIPRDQFLDFAWWDALSYSCGGLDESFLETEFNRMKRWLMDNPRRVPTLKGWRRFVAGWLERAHDKERRFPNGTPKGRK